MGISILEREPVKVHRCRVKPDRLIPEQRPDQDDMGKDGNQESDPGDRFHLSVSARLNAVALLLASPAVNEIMASKLKVQ